jgi:hypothetical protein
MINWFHRFMNPHCEWCRSDLEDSKVCQSCESLKAEIEYLKHHNHKLLEALLDATRKPDEGPRTALNIEDLKPISSKNLPWPARRQQLELEARRKFEQQEKAAEDRLLKEQDRVMTPAAIEDLETKLGVS